MVGQRLKEILPAGGEEQIYGSLGLLLREWKGSHVVRLNLKWVISGDFWSRWGARHWEVFKPLQRKVHV